MAALYRTLDYGWDAAYDASQFSTPDYVTYNEYQAVLSTPINTPEEMEVDGGYVSDHSETEKTDLDVTFIDTDQTPTDATSDIELEEERPRADDGMPEPDPRGDPGAALIKLADEAMRKLVYPKLVEDPETVAEGHHTWNIKNWRQLSRREHGPTFEVGGFPWRVLMFPSGNNQFDQASFYLEQGFPEGSVPEDFVCCVQFGLVLWNPHDPTIFQTHTATHRFTKEEGDWGFTKFVELRKLFSVWPEHGRPLVENDEANLTAYVRVVKDETGVMWHNFTNYDSKKETGYVGLKNQGATCYLNSLIQSLYFTNTFRKAVYQIPTQNEETLTNSAYTLQRLFYMLQTHQFTVNTSELTKSFGWETRHVFEQQDVQELSRKLMERMEEKMKGTAAENALANLFSGKVRTYISCINVDYESRRVEDFWDIQLNVSGQANLIESFKDYIMVETMEGENQYHAGDVFKLQDAKKGVIFESFPDVLNLQLKRFQYDMNADAMMKINSRYEFPETFDASPYLAEDADKSEPYIYQLHSVLVHSGDLNAGHYYAFIRPEKDGWFYRYDDDRVTKATMREVLEENYGGPYTTATGEIQLNTRGDPFLRPMSAYMLVYIRQTRIDQVLLPITIEDTPAHLQKRLDDEDALRKAKKKEIDESHLYLNVKVVTDETFKAHTDVDLTTPYDVRPDQNPAAPRVYRVLRKSNLSDLVSKVAADQKCDPKRLRLWNMVNRQNRTTRPDLPVPESVITVEDAQHKFLGSKQDLRFWAELSDEVDSDGETVWQAHPPGGSQKSDIIVLFLKHFNEEEQTLTGAGHIYINREKKVEDVVPLILSKMGWPEKNASGKLEQLKLFEEIKPTMVEQMKAKQTLKAAELQDGDILCFQRVTDGKSPEPRSSETSSEQSVLPTLTSQLTLTDSDRSSTTSGNGTLVKSTSGAIEDAKAFYEWLHHRKVIHFYPHPRNQSTPEQEPFDLTLSMKCTYDHFATKVAEKLGVPPTHLRFWTINGTNNNPKVPVKRTAVQTLTGALNPAYSTFSNQNGRGDALYFEILDIPLSEMDTKRVVKVVWLSEGITKEDLFELIVPKSGTVEDLVAALIKRAKLEDEATAGPIRVWEASHNKFHKEMSREYSISTITDFLLPLYAERIPEEDLTGERNEYITVMHFQNDINKAHGVPFKFHIKQDEQWSTTKVRLEKRTGLKGKNFEKIKFAVIKKHSYAKPIYLTDEDVLWDVASNDDDMLGLDHVDRSRVPRNGAGDLFLK